MALTAAAGAGIKYRASALRDNETAQDQEQSRTRNFYVSVERSGGGV